MQPRQSLDISDPGFRGPGVDQFRAIAANMNL